MVEGLSHLLCNSVFREKWRINRRREKGGGGEIDAKLIIIETTKSTTHPPTHPHNTTHHRRRCPAHSPVRPVCMVQHANAQTPAPPFQWATFAACVALGPMCGECLPKGEMWVRACLVRHGRVEKYVYLYAMRILWATRLRAVNYKRSFKRSKKAY